MQQTTGGTMTESKVDPNEAPEGFIAVEWGLDGGSCDDCEFSFLSGNAMCPSIDCTTVRRKDKSSVYFIKKPDEPTHVFKNCTIINDPINHPPHYTQHPSGIECIQITEHMGFCLGTAVEYIWRADLKNDAIEDLKKAIWYIQREIDKRGGGNVNI